jgi:hypothetical protein
MKPAWRGVVFMDEVWAWPMILMDHQQAFTAWRTLEDGMTCRWRQWEPGGKIDFDHGASEEDMAKVREWVERNS